MHDTPAVYVTEVGLIRKIWKPSATAQAGWM